MKSFIRKIRSNKGMSLGEALATVLIMSFVTLAIAAGVTAGVRVYRRITVQAESETLLATNVAALSQYLEKGHNISTDNNSITIGYSEVSGTKVVIKNGTDARGEKGIYIQYYKLNDNAEGNSSPVDVPDGTLKPLISTESNTSGLYAELSLPDSKNSENAVDVSNTENKDLDHLTRFKIDIKDSTDTSRNVSETVQVRNTIQYPTESDSE